MKITSIELYSNERNSASFSFRDPLSQNPYIVQGVFGLDADEIIPKFYGFSVDGARKFYNMSLKSRTIVIRVALNPNLTLRKSYSDLRDDLYRVISASRTGEVQLRFLNGKSAVASIFGFIKKFEAPQFNQLPEVQLTIECTDPMFRALDYVEVAPGALGTSMTINDIYSTSPHGFSFELTFNADTPNFIMRDAPSNWTWSFSITPGTIGANTGFKNNDVLKFSSELNKKEVSILRASTTILLVDRVDLYSTWPIMFPGANDFDIITGAFTWGSMSYYPTYWGV